MFKLVNDCYVSMLVVVTNFIVKEFDVVLAAIVALEVRMLVHYLSATSSILLLSMSVCNEFICTNRLMFLFVFVLLGF